MLHIILLLGCAVTIYLACEAFVNAVEWLGVRMKVGPVAVGTILAAVGTALPESVVTLVAVLFGGSSGKDIGVGAALGGPLVVGTVAYAVVGGMLLLRERRARTLAPASPAGGSGGSASGAAADERPLDGADIAGLARDQTWFLSIFVVKVGLGLV
ncbi:MAG: sodium/calcium exchanger rane protein, partial [Frankiales bacterium]|nr:sodium/calcium exchanger rane protein [Frankiales bacterium]